ncbi:hypothetical protein ABTX24_23805 [Nocardioides sp. NPDC127514]|uniref:hypothetical protein n=1 Tax=unclassified Nocardioides TaxID=2615069 RepID=UPI00331F67C6
MSYDPQNLRDRMKSSTQRPQRSQTADQPSAAAAYFDFSVEPPNEVTDNGSRTWWVRGQNFVLAFSWAAEGEVFTRTEQKDEYVVLVPRAGTKVRAAADIGPDTDVEGPALLVMPPGASELEIHGDGPVIRLFTTEAEDLVARCRNQDDYAEAHAHVAPLVAWPGPVDGHRIRAYRIGEHPYEPTRFGRLFRCSTFMVNWFDPDQGPRDPDALSPHLHDDFEQCSLALEGSYVHHIRSPWTSRLSDWREDDHRLVASPSIAIIPPPALHTSQSVGQVRNHLIDIFCPPRVDFSNQDGWVINAAEYPMPDVDDEETGQ